MEYAIIEAGRGCQKLAKMVNKAIADGWTPLGGPFVLPISHGRLCNRGDHGIDTAVCQAMVHHEPNNGVSRPGTAADAED